MTLGAGQTHGIATGKRTGLATGKRTGVATGKRTGVATGKRTGVATGKRTGVATAKSTVKSTGEAAPEPQAPAIANSILDAVTPTDLPAPSGVPHAQSAAVVATGTDPAEPEMVKERRGRLGLPLVAAVAFLFASLFAAMLVGPVGIGPGAILATLAEHIPLVHVHSHLPALEQAIVWQVRAPRTLLAALVGAVLAGGGAAYQGVFRNPLADPYLLGVAAGAGLGATLVIAYGGDATSLLAPAAFLGGVLAVVMTYAIGSASGARSSGRTIVLGGVAVAALLTALQTYFQQQHTQQVQEIYYWLLGSLSLASWSDVRLILPYAAVSLVVLLAHRRLLDVLRVGEDEAGALGMHVGRTRLVIIGAATLGTAAAVAVSGLIGFVGIIVPHAIRMTTSASYRVVLPVSMIAGAGFLVLADLVARTVEAPAEVPIGVVTAFVGAPFFLLVLRSRRSRQGDL